MRTPLNPCQISKILDSSILKCVFPLILPSTNVKLTAAQFNIFFVLAWCVLLLGKNTLKKFLNHNECPALTIIVDSSRDMDHLQNSIIRGYAVLHKPLFP